MTVRKLFVLAIIFGGLGFGGWKFTQSDRYQQWRAEQEKQTLPAPEQIAENNKA